MNSKLITKIKNRPNYYCFDTALKDDQKITVKYCLFTEDDNIARTIAIKLKSQAGKKRGCKINNNHNGAIRSQMCNRQRSIKGTKTLYITEYRELFERVIRNFYSLEEANKEQIYIEPKQKEEAKALYIKEPNFKEIAIRYIQNETKK